MMDKEITTPVITEKGSHKDVETESSISHPDEGLFVKPGPRPTRDVEASADEEKDGDVDGATGSGLGGLESLRRTASNVLSHVASRMTTRSWPEPPPPPDGGMKAWIQVAMGWLVIFSTWGYNNSFGAFQTYYQETMPQSPSTISWIGSVQVWLTLSFGAFSGRALDAGLFLPAFIVGAILQVLGMFTMSISTKYWQLMITQGVLTGLGGGIFFTPSLALVTTYFKNRRALAVGLATTGNSTGGIIYPLIVRELLPKLGFAWTARVLAFVNLTFLLIVAAFMRPRLPPRKSGPLIDLSAFKESVYVTFVFGWFLTMWSNYYTFDYIASYGTSVLNLPYSTAAIMVIVINGVGLPFRVAPPWIADKIGVLNVVIPTVFIWWIVSFCWLAVKDNVGYWLFTVWYGMPTGAFQCLLATVVASITMRLDMVGTRLGMAFGIVSFGALTGPPIGGAIISASGGSYTAANIWAAAVTLVAWFAFVTARVLLAGWNPKVKV